MPLEPAENRYLIAIGSPECPKMGLARLERVAFDIDRMCSFLTSESQGYRRALATEIPVGAESKIIKYQLINWFSDPDREETDCVIIYYAGHADTFGKFGSHYLLTYDSEPRTIQSSAIKTAELPEILFEGEGLRPQSVLLILDTCHAGTGSGQATAVLSKAPAALAGGGAGFWLVASSGPDDIAGDGSFVDAFLAAVSDTTFFGLGAAEFLNPIDIAAAVNESFAGSDRGQRAEGSVLQGGRNPHSFIRNTGYAPDLVGSVLEDLQHWDPKARGVESVTTHGDYFVGREKALTAINEFLNSECPDLRARVVTGGPGSGKSAVLGRLVVNLRRGEQSAVGAAAVHAHRLSLPDIVDSMGQQLGVRGRGLGSLLDYIGQPGPSVRIIFDALDEALDPRLVEEQLLVPLAASARVRLVVGTRVDRSGRRPLGVAGVEIDLDSPTYFEQEDIKDYVFKRLTKLEPVSVFTGEKDHGKAKHLAGAVAYAASHSFLYARVVSRWLARSGSSLNTDAADWVDRIQMPNDVTDAFGKDLDRFDSATKRKFVDLLIPLAYAQGKGLPQKVIWCQIATAISGRKYTNADIRELKEKASFYLVRDVEENENVYRLFHEAFAEYLRGLTRDEEVHRVICECLIRLVTPEAGGKPQWAKVHEPYILNYLAVHADHATVLEPLLLDAEFLIHASPQTLVESLRSVGRHESVRIEHAYLRAYPKMDAADLPVRTQYLALGAMIFGASELLAQLQTRTENCSWFPLNVWQRDIACHVVASLPNVQRVCIAKSPDGLPKLVAMCADEVRVLKLSSGEALHRHTWRHDDVCGVAEIPDAQELIVAAATTKGMLCVLNMTRGIEIASRMVPRTHDRGRMGQSRPHLCVLAGTQPPALVSGGEDGAFQVWTLPGLDLLYEQKVSKAAVSFLGRCEIGDHELLILCSDSYRDGKVVEKFQVRLWDVNKKRELLRLRGPVGNAAQWSGLVNLGGNPYLCAYFWPSFEVWLYDASTGDPVNTLKDFNAQIFGMADQKESVNLLSGFSDKFRVARIRRKDALSSAPIVIDSSAGVSVNGGIWCGPTELGGRAIVTSVRDDVRVWDLEKLLTKADEAVEEKVGQIEQDGEPLFWLTAPASGRFFMGLSRFGNLRVWSQNGKCLQVRQVVPSLESSMDFDFVHMADHHGKVVYVSAGRSGLVQSWELSGKPVYPPVNVGRQIDAFLAAEVKGHLLAFAAREDDSGDHAVRVWDLGSGKEIPTDQVVDFSGRLAPRFRFDKTGVKAVTQIAVVNAGQGRMLVSSARGPHGGPYSWVHAWSLEDKELEWVSTMGHKVVSLTPLTVAGVSAVAGADADGWIRVWRASDGDSLAEWHSDHRSISQLCITRVEGNDLLISAGTDGTIVGWGFQFKRAFIIDAGDPVNSLVSLADHQIVAGTDRGFMQFQLFPRAIKMLSSKSRAVR